MRIIKVVDNIVVEVKEVTINYTLQQNEVESAIGEIGQIQQQDGTFIDPEPTQTTQEPTLEDKINYIYYKQMGVI